MSTKQKRAGSPRALAFGALAFDITFLRPQMLKWGTRLAKRTAGPATTSSPGRISV